MQSRTSPGRNNLFENLLRQVSGFVKSFFTGQGRPRSLQANRTYATRTYIDLEISEVPIRDPVHARELVEMAEYCPEVATAIEILTGDTLQSGDGDDQGFTVGDFRSDGITPVNPEVKAIANSLIQRLLGGSQLEPIIDRFLSYGDAFLNLSIDSRMREINGIVVLPTWEVFRIEDDYGHPLRFEQRSYVYDPDPVIMHPITVVHWRWDRKYVYGRSLYKQAIMDWARLKDATNDLAMAARATGTNPNKHIMPEGADKLTVDAYREGYEAQLADGVVTDFYLAHGQDVLKVANQYPDLTALANTVLLWRSRIAMRLRIPPWLLGLPSQGARDIQGAPERAYARLVYRVRGVLTEGIVQIIKTELALKGIDPREWDFKIRFPPLATNTAVATMQAEAEVEEDGEGITDLDSLTMVSNGRRHGR